MIKWRDHVQAMASRQQFVKQQLPIRTRAASGTVQFAASGAVDRLIDYQVASDREDFYDEFYRAADTGLRALRELQVDEVAASIQRHRSGVTRLLDVGCGNGHAVQYLQSAYAETLQPYGIDPHTRSDAANVFRLGLLELAEAETSLPATFDCLTFLDVLEHFGDPGEALRLSREHLAADGLLVIKVPNKASLIYRLARGVRWLVPGLSARIFARLFQLDYPPPHYVYFDAASLENLLAEQGFVTLERYYQSELPWRLLWRRLWGLRLPVRVLAFVCLLPIKLVTVGALNDGLVVIARRDAKRVTQGQQLP